MKWRQPLLFAALTLFRCATMPETDRLIIHGGPIVTGTGAGTLQDRAILVDGGKILAITTLDEARRLSSGREIDVRGATILPGLVDAHGHIDGLGLGLERVNLNGATSEDEMAARAAAKGRETPEGEWVFGRGWDQNDWPSRAWPTAAALDRALPGRRIWLKRIDGHAGVASTAAMQAAGVTRETPDPAGGQIIRDSAGNPTGVFIDNAMDLIEKAIPAPSREARRRTLQRAVETIASLGLTGVHDAGVDDETVSILRDLADEGKLPIRVYAMLGDDAALLEKWFRAGPLRNYNDLLTVRSVKLYADGALGSRGAALLAPYSDDPSNSGLVIASVSHISDVASRAKAAGFQVNTHAIGDRGVRNVLDAYDAATVGPSDRYRIEHFQVAHLDDIRRLASMGVIASMQPTHATSDMPWAERRVGPERIRGAYAWRRVLDAGGRLAFGSDFPVEEVNPLLGIYAAVTRQDLDGQPPGGWLPDQRMTAAEALRGFTADAAYASFDEGRRGTIDLGKDADFTVLDRNPLEVPPVEIPRLKVRYTVVGGRVVYAAP
jgi:predicted amidohydrolase YtcJ